MAIKFSNESIKLVESIVRKTLIEVVDKDVSDRADDMFQALYKAVNQIELTIKVVNRWKSST